MLSVICFSKDRPLQLEAYIESLMHFGGIKPQCITALITASPGISYDKLKERLPDVNWVSESDFQADLLRAISPSEDYVLLGCDDVVFKEYFDINDCIRTLALGEDIFGFSLRLGTKIRFMPDLSQQGGICTWEWGRARDSYWRYAWDVSASIYRRGFIENYLNSRSDLANPNRFEDYLAKEIAAGTADIPSKLACFAESCCATITINRVQDEYPNAFDSTQDTGLKALYQAHLDGLKQDWPKLAHWKNSSVHVGAHAFKLTRNLSMAPPRYNRISGSHVTVSQRRMVMRARVIWWRAMAIVWESMRQHLPYRVVATIRRIMLKVMS